MLLQALLVREYQHLQKLQQDTAKKTNTLEHVVRESSRLYFSYIKERGFLIQRLESNVLRLIMVIHLNIVTPL